MAGGGGGIKLKLINFVLDQPVKAYIGGGVALYLIRRYQVNAAYGKYFGKIDYERRLERNEL